MQSWYIVWRNGVIPPKGSSQFFFFVERDCSESNNKHSCWPGVQRPVLFKHEAPHTNPNTGFTICRTWTCKATPEQRPSTVTQLLINRHIKFRLLPAMATRRYMAVGCAIEPVHVQRVDVQFNVENFCSNVAQTSPSGESRIWWAQNHDSGQE